MMSNEEYQDGLLLASVSDVGENHRILCMPNQDAVGYKCLDGDFVLAVSDGVGSCSMSQRGANIAVEVCIVAFLRLKKHTLEFKDQTLSGFILDEWRRNVGNEASLNDHSTTLKVVFKVGSVVKLLSLGDGIVAVSSNGRFQICPIDERRFVNETKCLGRCTRIEDFWTSDFYLDDHTPYVAFCCTDGIANSIEMGKEFNVINDIEKNIKMSDLKKELEDFTIEIGKYSFDDRTIGVVKYNAPNKGYDR